jgi:hypothetical protein
MFKLYFLTYVADVVASVTLNYQLIQNSLEFEVFYMAHSFHTKLPYGSFSTLGTRAPNQPL